MTTRRILAANWKMNLAPKAAIEYAKTIRAACSSAKLTDVWVAPTLVALQGVSEVLAGSPIAAGAQNVHWADSGAFTGETSPSFLKELGVTWALAGHSERRHLFGESSALVAKRVVGALAFGITPVLCVGETESERMAGTTETVLKGQLEPVINDLVPESRGKLVIAYEPVWAIGTGKVATVGEIRDAHKFIKERCVEAGFDTAPMVLYGGSVNPGNYAEIVSTDGVDGALVGGASLKIEQWRELLRISEAE
jgi:triosephosphate isomerase